MAAISRNYNKSLKPKSNKTKIFYYRLYDLKLSYKTYISYIRLYTVEVGGQFNLN